MLVLSRHRNESVVINGGTDQEVVVTVVDIRGDKVRLGFAAPIDITIHREEIQSEIDREQAKGRRTR